MILRIKKKNWNLSTFRMNLVLRFQRFYFSIPKYLLFFSFKFLRLENGYEEKNFKIVATANLSSATWNSTLWRERYIFFLFFCVNIRWMQIAWFVSIRPGNPALLNVPPRAAAESCINQRGQIITLFFTHFFTTC